MTIFLLYASIFFVIAEWLFQMFWYRPYFSFGIPIFYWKSTGTTSLLALLEKQKLSLHSYPAMPTMIAIRQRYFGIARYAYFHGKIIRSSDGSEERLTLYGDYNITLVGAFIGSAISSNYAVTVLAAILPWVIAGVIFSTSKLGQTIKLTEK